jgi:hypothetical protein
LDLLETLEGKPQARSGFYAMVANALMALASRIRV